MTVYVVLIVITGYMACAEVCEVPSAVLPAGIRGTLRFSVAAIISWALSTVGTSPGCLHLARSETVAGLAASHSAFLCSSLFLPMMHTADPHA